MWCGVELYTAIFLVSSSFLGFFAMIISYAIILHTVLVRCKPALVAQRIERWPPEPKVRSPNLLKRAIIMTFTASSIHAGGAFAFHVC